LQEFARRSAIDGCPIAIKAIIATADMPTQMNSHAHLQPQRLYESPPDHDITPRIGSYDDSPRPRPRPAARLEKERPPHIVGDILCSFRQDLTLSIICREHAATPEIVEGVICDGHT